MNSSNVILMAIVMPVVMVVLLFGPLYAGCYAGLVWVYGYQQADEALSLDYQLNSYQSLITYARGHHVGFTDYLLPAFGPPIIGFLSGLVFFCLLARFLHRNMRNYY